MKYTNSKRLPARVICSVCSTSPIRGQTSTEEQEMETAFNMLRSYVVAEFKPVPSWEFSAVLLYGIKTQEHKLHNNPGDYDCLRVTISYSSNYVFRQFFFQFQI